MYVLCTPFHTDSTISYMSIVKKRIPAHVRLVM